MKQRYKTLADYFEQTGTTQTELATRLGISSAFMSMLVTGERRAGIAMAARIHELTGVAVRSLVSDKAFEALESLCPELTK